MHQELAEQIAYYLKCLNDMESNAPIVVGPVGILGPIPVFYFEDAEAGPIGEFVLEDGQWWYREFPVRGQG